MTLAMNDSSTLSSAKRDALFLFLAINVTAFSIAAIAAHQAPGVGLIGDASSLRLLLFVLTACIAVPVGGLAAQHKIDIEKLKLSFLELEPVDQLTGLLDRRFFERVLRDELLRMDRTGRPSAIALFEIDELAVLKERYGRSFQTATLRQVSIIAHGQLRGPFDKVSRWADDRFIVLMNNVSIAQAEHVCERLREEIASSSVSHKGQSTDITVSFGVSSFPPHSDIEGVLDRAESGLTMAQKYGGDRVLNDTPYTVPTAPATFTRRKDE